MSVIPHPSEFDGLASQDMAGKVAALAQEVGAGADAKTQDLCKLFALGRSSS